MKPKVRKYPLSEAEVAEVSAILQPGSENPASGTAEGLIDEEEIALDVESDCNDLESIDSDGGHSGANNSSGRGGSQFDGSSSDEDYCDSGYRALRDSCDLFHHGVT